MKNLLLPGSTAWTIPIIVAYIGFSFIHWGWKWGCLHVLAAIVGFAFGFLVSAPKKNTKDG